jgi:putative spermidine/putrescine transport system ATP-binding protein/putrescine transport system ATP-binding protein
MLELIDISKRFSSITAVDSVSFEVKEAEIASILGPSGCGKTTLLRLIAGFETAEEGGKIVIGGEDVSRKRPYERRIGLVFQDYALFPHLSVERNIAFGLREQGVARKKHSEMVRQVLGLVKLHGYEQRMPHQLSGGEQQRVALARAIVTRPSILLLDEPLSNLDAKLREGLRFELKQILAEAGITTVIVTHDQEEAMSLADHIIVMNKGRVMQRGTADQIYAEPQNRFVADFVGRSNWFSCHLFKIEGELAECRAEDGTAFLVPCARLNGRTEFDIAIRPERLKVTREANTLEWSPPNFNQLEGSLETVQNLGSFIHFWVRLTSGKRIQVIEQNSGLNLTALMDPIRISFAPDDCICLPKYPE